MHAEGTSEFCTTHKPFYGQPTPDPARGYSYPKLAFTKYALDPTLYPTPPCEWMAHWDKF